MSEMDNLDTDLLARLTALCVVVPTFLDGTAVGSHTANVIIQKHQEFFDWYATKLAQTLKTDGMLAKDLRLGMYAHVHGALFYSREFNDRVYWQVMCSEKNNTSADNAEGRVNMALFIAPFASVAAIDIRMIAEVPRSVKHTIKPGVHLNEYNEIVAVDAASLQQILNKNLGYDMPRGPSQNYVDYVTPTIGIDASSYPNSYGENYSDPPIMTIEKYTGGFAKDPDKIYDGDLIVDSVSFEKLHRFDKTEWL